MLKKNHTKFIVYIVLFIIILGGLFFRLEGIQDNHSFWSDEADISSYARELLDGENLTQITQRTYQPLQIFLVSLSFNLFGFSEWSARLPTVLFSTLGILFAYLLATRLSNYAGGLLAAFLYAFSQLNLAHATQVKPYAIIETSIIVVAYLVLLLSQTELPRLKRKLHFLIIFVLTVSSFLHPGALLTWLIYIIYLIAHLKAKILSLGKNPLLIISILVFLFLASASLKLPSIIFGFIIPDINNINFNNNTTYLRELLWKNYSLITLPAIIGVIITFRKNMSVMTGIVAWILILLFIWNFRAFHNVRYIMPIFGLMIVFFGVFWAIVGDRLLNKKSLLVCALVIILLYAGGDKISRKPQVFYNPNKDLAADIQIADYKSLFNELKNKFPEYKTVPIFNSFIDPQRWYLKTHPSVYLTRNPEQVSAIDNRPAYGNLKDFLKAKEKYPKGLLIVEDWQSILPDDIKEYAKKNLKREIRVEGLPQANGDNWPLEVYSWGIN